MEPDNPVPFRRAPIMVESKLTTSLGEAVHGQPLPPNVLPAPTSSFDDRGFFVGIIKPPGAEQPGTWWVGWSVGSEVLCAVVQQESA